MYHANATIDALMKRGYLYLEDHEWKSAKGYFDDALDVDPENAKAYIGMLLAEMHIERECDLYTAEQSFVENYYIIVCNFQYVVKWAHFIACCN